MTEDRGTMERRVCAVIGDVARQALADRGLARIALLDDGGPGAALAARILAGRLGEASLVRVALADGDLEPLLHRFGRIPRARAAEELRRMMARVVPHALAAHPASKTELLLSGAMPPEPLLPLGDLYASDVARMGGGLTLPPEVEAIADAAGGAEALDGALRAWIDRRDANGLDALPSGAAAAVRAAFAAGRAARTWPRIVPKLGHRTLGVDLHE